MKKITSTPTRLLQYAASATAFLGMQQVNATVVYTDLDPDQLIGGEGAEFTIDMNEDGTDDFNFSIYSFSGTGTYLGFTFTYGVKVALAAAINGNEILGEMVTYSGYSGIYAPVLPDDEAISSGDNFAEGAGTLGVVFNVSLLGAPYYSYTGGNWLDTSMGFMGIRINIDKDRYYGWIRLSVSDDAATITIHDYAYESEPNKPIFTGQTATGIEEMPIMQAEVYANGNILNISIPEDLDQLDGSLFDLSGKLVKKLDISAGTQAISCNELASGNYIVSLQSDSGVYRKQVHLSE